MPSRLLWLIQELVFQKLVKSLRETNPEHIPMPSRLLRLTQVSNFVNLAKIGLVVVATFGLIWGPFLPQIEHVLTRVFPLNRGLFEDKVANFRCALNVLFKIKTLYTSDMVFWPGVTHSKMHDFFLR